MVTLRFVDVVIIGGGVTGTAVLKVLSEYTTVQRLVLIEKYSGVGQENSNPRNNSQTLHFGDIETNYTLDKAPRLKAAGHAIKRYVERKGGEGDLFRKSHKMVLAVGAEEVGKLEERFRTFRALYPNLQRLDREAISQIEPHIVEGRDPNEPILALLSPDGYAVNYQRLAEEFLKDALASSKEVSAFFNTGVKAIRRAGSETGYSYIVETDHEMWYAKAVVVGAGPYSLIFAQAIGYGRELGILPVAGSFYFSKHVLNGKVYTMQDPHIPFAAIHGDPDVIHPDETRFGPTAKPLPLLERHRYLTFFDFLRTPIARISGLVTLVRIFSDPTLRGFIIRNMLYEIPVLGKWFLLKSVRKIIPTMRYSQLQFGKGLGGIRPQVVNIRTKELQAGEAKIVGDRIIFVTTPSPGASVCLKNAEEDAKKIVEFLGETHAFDATRFNADFGMSI